MNRDEWVSDLQFNLKALIRESGLSIREVSRRSGLSPITISRYLRGIQVPSLEAIINLAQTLDCDVEDIVELCEKIE